MSAGGLTADALIADPRFWAIERAHYGHNGECSSEGRECWRMRIGVHIVKGCVTWIEGVTFQAALAKADRALAAGPHDYVASWEPGHRSYLYVSCGVCYVDGYAHDFPAEVPP